MNNTNRLQRAKAIAALSNVDLAKLVPTHHSGMDRLLETVLEGQPATLEGEEQNAERWDGLS